MSFRPNNLETWQMDWTEARHSLAQSENGLGRS